MNQLKFIELNELVWKAYPEVDPDGEGFGTAYAVNQLFSKIVKEKALRIDYMMFVTFMRGILYRFNTSFINVDSFIMAVRVISPLQRFSNIALMHYGGNVMGYAMGYIFTETSVRGKRVRELMSSCYRDMTSKFMMVWEEMLLLPSLNTYEEDLEKFIQCACSSRKNFLYICENLNISELEVYKAFLPSFDIWSIFDDDYFKNVERSLWGEDIKSYQQIHLLQHMTQRCKERMDLVCEHIFQNTDAVENFIVFLMNCIETPAIKKRSMMQIYTSQRPLRLTISNPAMMGSHVIVWRIKKIKPCILNVERMFPGRPACQKLYMDWYIKNVLGFSKDVYTIIGSTFFPYFILGEYLITTNDESLHSNFDLGFEHILNITFDINYKAMAYSPFFELEYVDTLSDFKIYGCYMTGLVCSTHKRIIIKGLEGYALPADELAHELINIQLRDDLEPDVKYQKMSHRVDNWYVLEKNRPLKDLILTYDNVTLPTFIQSQLTDLINNPSLYKRYYDRIGYLFPTLWTFIECSAAYLYTFGRLYSSSIGDDDELFSDIYN